MKVSELTGVQLNYWVAKALGEGFNVFFEPSTVWAHGGPIIEWKQIALIYHEDQPYGGPWLAALLNGHDLYTPEVNEPDGEGPTPLIAAMRALVASVFGQEVPDAPSIQARKST